MTNPLREIIREEFEKVSDPNPRRIAKKVLKNLSQDVLEEALMPMIEQEIRVYFSGIRANTSQVRTTSRRWQNAARTVMEMPVCVEAGNWKLLKDCTRDDVQAVANRYHAQSSRLQEIGESYSALSKLMQKKKAYWVSDLSLNTVEDVLHREVQNVVS